MGMDRRGETGADKRVLATAGADDKKAFGEGHGRRSFSMS